MFQIYWTVGRVARWGQLRIASYPRQNALAVALREIGRIERILWLDRI
jgi:hypothetical protein